MYVSVCSITSPVAATATTVTTLYGSTVVPEPVTGVWLIGVNTVHTPRLSVEVVPCAKKSGA
jgi:hypothetical protein